MDRRGGSILDRRKHLKEKMICMLQSSGRISSDEVQVSQEYKMLEDEAARNLLAAR